MTVLTEKERERERGQTISLVVHLANALHDMKHAFFGLILLAWKIPLLHCALSTISLFWIKSGCSYRSYYSLWTKSSSLDQVVRFGSRQSTIVYGDPNTELRENQAMARAAIAQLCSTPDKIANLVAIARCAGLAKKSGACMVS